MFLEYYFCLWPGGSRFDFPVYTAMANVPLFNGPIRGQFDG